MAPLIFTSAGEMAPVLQPPLGHDLRVGPVTHQHLQRGEDGLVQVTGFRYREAVRRRAVRGADGLELAVGLLDRVGRDRRVRHHDLRPAARQRQVGTVLVREREDGDVGLAALLALHALGGRVGLLGRALLDRDGLAAQVGQAAHGCAARRLGDERRSRGEVIDEVDDLLAGLGVGERRRAHVVLARGQTGDDAVERLVDDLGLQPHDRGERLAQIRVHPDDGVAVGREELVGGVAGVRGDGEGAL